MEQDKRVTVLVNTVVCVYMRGSDRKDRQISDRCRRDEQRGFDEERRRRGDGQ